VHVKVPGIACGILVFEVEPRLEALEAEPGDEASKLNLKREDRDGVEGTVTADLVPMWVQKSI
jgi:hypothetical protein